MAEGSKTILFYMLALAGLILSSILFTGRIEPLPLEPQPPAPVKHTGLPTPARPTEVAQEGCSPNAERIIFYGPDPTTLEDHRLLISGAVYASDFVTPLPGAVLEVLSAAQPFYSPYQTFHDWFQTDATGRYKATIPKPDDDGIIYLYYRANAQDDCSLRLQLLFRDTSAQDEDAFPRMKRVSHAPLPSSSLRQMKMVQLEPAGLILGGPIDVVLPVPPPVSFRTNLIPPGVSGERLTISGVVYAADGETPLPDARVEVWQAIPTDFYLSHAYPAPAFNLGGQMLTDAAGRYEFTTLKPGPLKADQTSLPARIHFKVSYQDQEPLLTPLFFADDPYLANIPAAPDLAIRLSKQAGSTGPVWQGNFDVVLPISTR